MQRRFGLGPLLVTALLSVLLLVVGWAMPIRARAAGLNGIHVSGSRLVDGYGNTVTLHGVDRSGTEYACSQGWGLFDGPNDAASVASIASWHVNAVRVPLNEDCWLAINGVPPAYAGAGYQTAIANYVALLESYGIYPILDLHWTAPGTALASGQEPMPDQDHTPAFWSSVASHFKSDPNVVFDVFNEPYPDNNQDTVAAWTCWRDGGTCSGASYQVAGMQELVNTIRSAGANNVAMLGGVEYSNALGSWLAYEPSDATGQLAASFHTYNFNYCDTVACWNTNEAPLATHVPVITGEFGEDDSSGTFNATWMNWADAHGISYLAWTWDTWGCGGPVLISDYNGTACQSDGTVVQQHYASLAGCTGTTLIGNFTGTEQDVGEAGANGVCVFDPATRASSKWTSTPFYGNLSTVAGDVNGDRKADVIAINSSSVWVLPSTGSVFGSPQEWSAVPFYGTRATLVGDVSGDGQADLIAVNDGSTWVMTSGGGGFRAPQEWIAVPFYGTKATLVADVNGDGKADLVAINSDSVWVMLANPAGNGFQSPQEWSAVPFYGTRETVAGDATGDGKADLVAINDGSTWLLRSTGGSFAYPAEWSAVPFYGTQSTIVADMNGDGRGDLVAINSDSVWTSSSTGGSFGSPNQLMQGLP